MDWEFNILNYIQDNVRNGFLDTLMSFWSFLGNMSWIWIVLTVVLLCFKRTRRIGIICVIGFGLSFLIANCIIKPIVARIRPYEINTAISLLLPKQLDYSFPSGHTVYAMCYATIFFRKNKAAGIYMFLFAVIMGFSRIYLYMHFPTDVLFGAVLGIIIGFFSVSIENKWHEAHTRKHLKKIS